MRRNLVRFISLLYACFMAGICVYSYSQGKTFEGSVAAAGTVCAAIPFILTFIKKLTFNLPIILSYLVFLFGSQYLGSIRGWYGLGWWDTLLHFLSGALLGFTGVALYERLAKRAAKHFVAPMLIFLFTLSFAVFGGVIWEIYEFSSDQLFSMTLQGGGNEDTMSDLLADTGGGLIVAIWSGIRTKLQHKENAH